jgi:pyridoxine kinase
MPLALILSSFVSASRVGGGGQQHVFQIWKIDPCLVPTVVFGRRPGKGATGGAAVAPDAFRSALAAVEAEGLSALADAVVTGYFAHPDQVRATAEAIDRARAAPRRGYGERLRVVVDPIMGDAETGLYVREDVAAALAAELLPRADWITPNVWELARLSGRPVETAEEAVEAARALGKPALVTSVPAADGRIGILRVEATTAALCTHALYGDVPKGTGDLVTAVFTAELIQGGSSAFAAESAARAAAACAEAAHRWKAPELPIVDMGARLSRPAALARIERRDL